MGTTSLEQWLVNTTTSSNDTDGSTRCAGDDLLGTTGQTDTGHLSVLIVSDNGGIVAGSTCKSTTVACLAFNIAHDRTFGERAERENVADVDDSLLSTVDELAGGHTLGSNERLCASLEAVWVAELNASERSTTATQKRCQKQGQNVLCRLTGQGRG